MPSGPPFFDEICKKSRTRRENGADSGTLSGRPRLDLLCLLLIRKLNQVNPTPPCPIGFFFAPLSELALGWRLGIALAASSQLPAAAAQPPALSAT